MRLVGGTVRRAIRVEALGAAMGVALVVFLMLCAVAFAPVGNVVGQAWADGGAGDLTASDQVAEGPAAHEVLGSFDIPEGAVSGTWGTDDYAASWYLADEGETLVVGPGTICTSSRDDIVLEPDFNGRRSSIKTVRFTQKAFIYPTASNLFAGFTSLVSVEGFSNLSGEYGVLSAHRMFAGCESLKSISVGNVKFSNYMEHPYTGGGMGVTDIMLSCRDAFEGCSALETLDLGAGWESGYVGPPVFGPEDEVFDGRATFPVDMADGTTIYAAGTPIPNGEGHYFRVENEPEPTTPGNDPAGPAEGAVDVAQPETPVDSGSVADTPSTPVKLEPTITVGKAYKSVTVKAAKKKARSFKIGAKSSSGGKLSYKVVKANKKMKFKAGTVTLKKGKYKPGKTYSMRVKVTSAARGDYAAASKTFALVFKVKR